MVVNSKFVFEHLVDLSNIFEILRRHKLHLNAYKCSFRVGSGKFLGYMVTHRGIEVNPDQIRAINDFCPHHMTCLHLSSNHVLVQCLVAGKVAIS